jgi:hypothetical protein
VKIKIMMKKTAIVFLVVLMGLVEAAHGQTNRAIGIRTGGGYGYGGELSLQLPLKSNRFELGLGWVAASRFNGVAVNGVYQFIVPLNQGFRWYYGLGGHVSSFDSRRNWGTTNEGRLGILGQVGVEYFFSELPLQLSLDARPGLFVGHRAGLGIDVGLGARIYF